jgi:polyhydroxybutyrate depolymerase
MPPAGVVGVASLVYRNVAAACEPAGSFPVGIVHGTADGLAYYLGFGLEAPFLSVPEAVDLWVDQLGCDAEPSITETPDQAQDFTSITTFRFGNCLGGHPVVHQRVNGGGHTWPGSVGPWGILAGRTSHNLDLTTEIVNLFRAVVDGG